MGEKDRILGIKESLFLAVACSVMALVFGFYSLDSVGSDTYDAVTNGIFSVTIVKVKLREKYGKVYVIHCYEEN